MTLLGSPPRADIAPHGPGGARTEGPPRTPTAVLSRDGWLALVLGTAARCYLVLLLSLTAIATLPTALGWEASVVQTGSMRPHIQPGDVVLSSPLPDSDPVPLGSVVQFTAPAAGGGEHQVVHRIVAPGDSPHEWVTQGDANIDPDSTALTRDKITGQGRLLVRWAGLPSLWHGTGQTGPLLAWLGVSLGAVCLSLWPSPSNGDLHRPHRRQCHPADGDDGSREGATRRRATGAPVVAAVAVLTAGTLALVAPEHASAAFTARTANLRSSFAVASWSTLSLGRATTYAVLAGTRINNADSHSTVVGSIGVSPGTNVSGFNAVDVTGSIDRNTPGAVNARTDALALYDAIGKRPATGAAPTTVTGTVRPGTLRTAGPVTVQGTVTFDAGGDPSAVFVVQAGTVTFAPGTRVVLANGAAPDKIFFVSGSTTTVGWGSALRGVLLGQGDMLLDKDAALVGRAISLQGAVTTKGAAVAQP
jgi:signal peptidase I